MGEPAWEAYQSTTRHDPSETALDQWTPDVTFSNNGTVFELEKSMSAFLNNWSEWVPRKHLQEEFGKLTGVLTPSYEFLERRIRELEALLATP